MANPKRISVAGFLLLLAACSDDSCPDASDCGEGGGATSGTAGGDGGSSAGNAGAGGASCAEGLTACGNTCVDTDKDPLHCGGCGQACDPAPEHGIVECAGFIEEGSCAYSCERGYVPEQVAGEPACVAEGG